MSKIRKSFQFHGRWGVSKQKTVGAKQDLIVAHLIAYGVFLSDHRRGATVRRGALLNLFFMRAISFLPIFRRFVRAGLIRRVFFVKVDDFGKNRRFPGFSSVDSDKIAAAMELRVRFCRFAVDLQVQDSHI